MNTTFTVSNTDVITMLVVEQREFLKNKRQEVLVEYVKRIAEQTEKEYAKVLAAVQKNKQFNDGFSALETLFKVINPKVKFKLQYAERLKDIVSHTISDIYRGYRLPNERSLEFSDIDIVLETETEEDEERLRFPWENGYEQVSLPFKYKSLIKADEKTTELSNELNRIDELLRNENTLKEKLIANVTKNAIKDIPEMSTLVTNINLLTN